MTSEQQAIKQIPWVRINDQSIIANPSQNSLILLNQSATIIWQAFRSGQSILEIARKLKMIYQINTVQAASDIELIINHWRQSGLMNKYSFNDGPGRWQKHRPFDHSPLSDKKPLHQITYQLNEIAFIVDYYDDEAFDSVHAVLRHLQAKNNVEKDKPEKFHRYQINHNGIYQLSESNRQSRQFNTLDELVEVMQWLLIESAYQDKHWLAVLHSAAIGSKNGQAIVFIAQRGSGKSTLSRLLQNHGLIYLADDVVPVNYSGELQPIPMCQRFKQGSWKVLDISHSLYNKTYARQEGHFVKYVKPLTGISKDWARNWPVKIIIYPQYIPKLNHFQLNKLNHVDSITNLCRSGSVFGGTIDQSQLESIVAWNRSIPSYSLGYSEVDTHLVDEIHALTS